MNAAAIALHSIAAAVWVGGMFFMLVVLRPSLQVLEPASRLPMMATTTRKFFPWVWMAIVVLMLTGYWLIGAFGGFSAVPVYVHIMHLLAWIMAALFAFMYFVPNKAFRRAVDANDNEQAAKSLNTVRLIVTVNFVLGLVMFTVVTGGRYW